MTNSSDYTDYMKDLSYPELIDIISKKRKEYNPEAIAAAEHELENRGFSTVKIKRIREEWDEVHSPDPYKANLPLPMNDKLMLLLFPKWFSWSHKNRLVQEGYFRQLNDITLWSALGYVTYFLIIVLSCVLAYLFTT